MAIVFKIDNLDKSNLINFDSLEVQDNLYSNANACYFTYEKYGGRTYVPAGGDEIGVWDGATKIFGGQIINVNIKIQGKVLVYEVECKDWTDQLDGKLVSETYENKTVNEIITDLQSKYATTFDITNVNCTTTIEAIYFDMKPMSKCLDELAERTGYHWYVDSDKKIYFFAEGSITSPFDITDTNGYCISDSLEITEDYEQIKNRINIQGGKIPNVQVHDDASITAYGEHEIIIRDDSMSSEAEATQKANAILAAYKDPLKKGGFETYEAGLNSGQKINVNSTLRGVNQDFIIESVAFKARTPTDFIYDIKIMTEQDKGIMELLENDIMKTPPVTEESFGNKHFTCSVKFLIVNYHKIEWEAGQIIMSSGEIYNIAAGNYEFTNTEICYFKPSTSETVLQFSTAFGDGVGEDRVALGYAIPNPNTAKGAQFIPMGFMGGVRFWGGENIVARTIIAEQIGLNALTSDLVTTGEFITLSAQIKNAIIKDAHITGTITVGKTEAKCTDPLADQTSVNTAADTAKVQGYTIIQGGYIKTDFLTADNIITGTLTGRTVQTAASGARVIMGGGTEWIKFYDATNLCGIFYGFSGNMGIFAGQADKNVVIYGGATSGHVQLADSGLGNIVFSTMATGVYVDGNISVTGTVDGIDILNHATNASAHHSKYTDSEARSAITDAGIPGTIYPSSSNSYNLGSSSYYWANLYLNYLRLNPSYGRIYHGSYLMLDFYGPSDKLSCKTPFGFEVRAGTPGAASSFQGYMYYDTNQADLVFSNGTNWYKVSATQI